MDRNTPPLTKILAIDKKILRFATASCLVMASAALTHASDWTGTASGVNWSTVYSSPSAMAGWIGSVPNTAGSTANFYGLSGTSTTSVVLDSAISLGSLSYSGSTGGTRTITVNANALTWNNNGSGATISNNTTGASAGISFGSGSYILADSLKISNANANYTGTNAIIFGSSANFSGTGNLTFSNVSNSTSAGVINWGGTSTFTGSVLIEKGAVVFGSTSSAFGNSANTITLGSAGNGSASLVGSASGSSATLVNNIVVASGTGGTLLLGNSGTGTQNTKFSGTVTLNGSVSLTSSRPTGNYVYYTNVISGAGSITTVGTGKTQFGDGSANITNTYKGNTTLTETSSLALSDNTKMTFYIGANGANNKITATGGKNNVLTLDGDFVFDLTGAAANGTWQIVDVSLLNETFSSTFSVYTSTNLTNPWTENANVWTYVNGGVTYSFSEATGILTAVPEPTTALLLGGGLMVLLLRRRRA